MSDDLSKASPPNYPSLHSHWTDGDLVKFRAALLQLRDPRGAYQMYVSDATTALHEPKKEPKEWLSHHFGNGADWTGNGRLGGKVHK